jgi:hypothetical protein
MSGFFVRAASNQVRFDGGWPYVGGPYQGHAARRSGGLTRASVVLGCPAGREEGWGDPSSCDLCRESPPPQEPQGWAARSGASLPSAMKGAQASGPLASFSRKFEEADYASSNFTPVAPMRSSSVLIICV